MHTVPDLVVDLAERVGHLETQDLRGRQARNCLMSYLSHLVAEVLLEVGAQELAHSRTYGAKILTLICRLASWTLAKELRRKLQLHLSSTASHVLQRV